MSDQTPKATKGKRGGGGSTGKKRGVRGKLTKRQDLDHVHVEDTFQFNLPDHVAVSSDEDRKVGEGCYVSATVHNRRYYGVLVDQASLRAASMLYFQDEASGLELNRKIEQLLHLQSICDSGDADVGIDKKRTADEMNMDESSGSSNKRARPDDVPSDAGSSGRTINKKSTANRSQKVDTFKRQVQKFRYVSPTDNDGTGTQTTGYRELLATYMDTSAAADDDPERERLIETACQSGGNFVGKYYYQHERKNTALHVPSGTAISEQVHALRTSMGLQSFLQFTTLPNWFPLSNLKVGQQKVLSMLNMKKDSSGNVVWDDSTKPLNNNSLLKSGPISLIPMEPRSRYRVCVVGGGIAGLSCCMELFRISDRERIDLEVVLVEGRNRLGGRIWTDHTTFKTGPDAVIPIDLGASWIHGIDLNPLAALATEAGANFVTTSENVKIYLSGMQVMDLKKDLSAGKLFDELLDIAANECWSRNETSPIGNRLHSEATIRWYSSHLNNVKNRAAVPPLREPPQFHRSTSDVSVDMAVGEAISKYKRKEFAMLSEEERNMLIWNAKNVEYALGANIEDLSMKFWDIDERHAFEGDHVLIRQGYSIIIDHMYRSLKKRGNRFTSMMNFSVGSIEYSRGTSTQPYVNIHPRNRKFVDLSESCCVTSQDGKQSVKSDFVVSAVPLGILKASLQDKVDISKIAFHPPLPFVKTDAIKAVGFGLLNKAFIQFPYDFWTVDDAHEPDQTQFGNASGVNPHLYMFLDVGKAIYPRGTSTSAILMTLISGREAVSCEEMSEKDFLTQIMDTLRILFEKVKVPDPIAFKVSRWGSDKFARGSYTFLGPGSTDEDFETLQSPVNGNGDSSVLEVPSSETMRLFFAGEHTTALFPSMAHGAMLSGARAAKEISESMILHLNDDEDDHDCLIPISYYRHMYPRRELRCCLCQQIGTRALEGKLLAFKKGSRQIICHANCAEYSPEIEVFEGKWKGVFSSVDKSRYSACVTCHAIGATVLCSGPSCSRCYHFSCASMLGWKYEENGTKFFCPQHKDSSATNDVVLIAAADNKSKQRAGDGVFVPNISDENERGTTVADSSSEDELDPIASHDVSPPKLDSITVSFAIPLAPSFKSKSPSGSRTIVRLGRISRQSIRDSWNVEFYATCMENSIDRILTIASSVPDPFDQFEKGDVVKSVNGIRIGSVNMDTIQKFFLFINQQVEVLLEVRRTLTSSFEWY